MTPCLAALCADDVGADLARLAHVLGVSDHVHVQHALAVQSVHDAFRWDSDGRDEQLRAALYDDVDELIERPLCVVVVRLPRGPADLRDEEVDAEGE